MVAIYQVIRHFLKSVGRVQTKGLVPPVALDADTGLPLIVWQVLVVPVTTSTEQIIKVREEFRGRRGKQKLFDALSQDRNQRHSRMRSHVLTSKYWDERMQASVIATCEIPEEKKLKVNGSNFSAFQGGRKVRQRGMQRSSEIPLIVGSNKGKRSKD